MYLLQFLTIYIFAVSVLSADSNYICRLSDQADNLHICSADYLYLEIGENALSDIHYIRANGLPDTCAVCRLETRTVMSQILLLSLFWLWVLPSVDPSTLGRKSLYLLPLLW